MPTIQDSKNLLVNWLNKNQSANVQTNINKSWWTNTKGVSVNNILPNQNLKAWTQNKLQQKGIIQPTIQTNNNSKIQAQMDKWKQLNNQQNVNFVANQNNQSRFIWLQNNNNLPSTDLAWNIIQENVDKKKKEEFDRRANKPVLNIPTKKSEIEQFNKKQSDSYRTNENVIKDFHYDVQKFWGQMTKEQISQLYPEFAGKEDIALMLQSDLLPLVQNNEFADMKKLSELYPELLPKQKKVGDQILKDQEKEGQNIKDLAKKAEKTLSRYNVLSKNWEKYMQDVWQVGNFVDTIRKDYKLPWNPSDMDIINFGKENIPELKAILDDMEILKSNYNLTERDRDIILNNGFDLWEWLYQAWADIQNFTQNNQLWDYLDRNSSTWERQLSNLWINGSSANTIANLPKKTLDTVEIPVNMVGSLTSWVGKVWIATERIATQQNRNEDWTTDYNWVVKDVIRWWGGALEIWFNTVMAIPTAIFHLANETDAWKSATDQVFWTIQDKLDKLQSWESTNSNNAFNQWYNWLDDETKADLLNEEMVALFSAIHKWGGKVTGKVKKLSEFEINSAKNAINEALQERFNIESSSATFKAKVEKWLADGTMKVSDDWMLTDAQWNNIGKVKVTKEKLSGTDKVKYVVNKVIADNRIAWNKWELNADVNMNALPDNRWFRDKAGEKAYNAGVKTREVYDTAKEWINKVKEWVKSINVWNAVKGTAEAVGKGVKATSDLYKKWKNAVTQWKNAVTNAVKENVVEPFKKGYEWVKETVNENIVEPYNKGRWKTSEFNKEWVNQWQQLQESNSTSEINNKVNWDNYTQKDTNSKKLNKVQLKLLQNNNRMNPKSIDTFKEWYGEDYGQYMYDRWFTKSADWWNLDDMENYKNSLLSQKRETLNKIEWTYQDISLQDMAEHLVEKAENVRNRKLLKEAQELQNKHNETWLTMPEADRLRTLFQQNVKMWFHQDIPADARERAKNEYMAVKEFLDDVGRKNWFDDLDNINREIQKTQHIIKGIESKLNRESANNAYTLTDYILMAEAFTSPQTAAVFTAKQILKNPKVRSAWLNVAVWGRGNAKNRVTAWSREKTNENVESIAGAKRKQKEMWLSETPALPNGIKLSKVVEIDNRKPTDTTPPSWWTPTGTNPTNNQGGTPKNKVTSKPKKSTKSVDKENTNQYNTTDASSNTFSVSLTEKEKKATWTKSVVSEQRQGAEIQEDIPSAFSNKSKTPTKWSNFDISWVEKEYSDNYDKIVSWEWDNLAVWKIDWSIAYDGKERPAIFSQAIKDKIDKDHSLDKQNLLWTIDKPDYIIKDFDKEKYPDRDKINLIRKIPWTNNFVLVSAERQNGFFILTNYEIHRNNANQMMKEISWYVKRWTLAEDNVWDLKEQPKNKVTAKKTEATAPKQEENQTKKFTYDEYGEVMNKIWEVEKKINNKLDKQYEQERAEKMSRFEELRDKEDKTDAEWKELVKLQGELNNMSNKYDKLKEDELKKQAPELLQQKEELQQAFDRDWKAAMDEKMEEMEKPFNDLRDEFRQKLRDELWIADDVILDEKYYNSLTPEQKKIADEINKEYAEKYEVLRQKTASIKKIEEESKTKITGNKKNKVTNPSKVKEAGLFNENEVDKGNKSEWLNPDALPLSDYREMQRLNGEGLDSSLRREDDLGYISTKIANEKVWIKPDWDDNEAWDKLPEDFEDDWETVASDIEDMYNAYEEYLDMKNGGDTFDENTLKNTLESANDYANRQFPWKTAKEVIDQYTPQYESDLEIYNRLNEKYPWVFSNWKIDLTWAEGKARREFANQENETAQDIDYQELAERENETPQVEDEELNTSPLDLEFESERRTAEELDENETPQTVEEEKTKNLITSEQHSEFETLPADVTVGQEAKQLWAKRIAPDRVPRQQLTFDEWSKKIQEQVKTVADYIQLKKDYYDDMYGQYEWDKDSAKIMVDYSKAKKDIQQILWEDWQFKSNKSKEFTDLRNNIKDNIWNEKWLNEVAKNFYISKVKKDISKGYVYPQEVLDKIPWAKKAIDNRERYEKWLNTSFSAKDERIDYSEKDKIWAWMKSQDWKQITKEQKEDIVKWILDFGKTLWLDMKKFAEDRWLVYVHLHGWLAFLNNMAAWLYRESTNEQWEKNISVSVWWAENVRYKDPKTKERKTTTLNTTMSHELGHAMDYLLDNKLFSWTQKSILGSKYNPVNRLRKYYAKWNEIVARAIEQYVAVENWQPNYYLENWNLDAGEFKWTDLEYALKEVGSYYERPWYWSKPDYEKYVKPYVEEAFRNNFEEYKINKSQKNVLWNDKNKVTTQAARASRPSIRMNVDEWEKKNITSNPMNKVTSNKNYDIPLENKTKVWQAITKMRNNAESWWVKVARYTKNWPLENALNTIYNINSIKRKIRWQDHYNNVLNWKEEWLLSIAEILDWWYKDEDISYKRFYDPLDEKHPTIIFWKWDNIDGATKTWALHLNKNDNTNPAIDKFRDSRWRLEVTPLRRSKRWKKK